MLICKVKDLNSDHIYTWTMEQVLEEINRDHSEEWENYTELDWFEGWYEWCEGDYVAMLEFPKEWWRFSSIVCGLDLTTEERATVEHPKVKELFFRYDGNVFSLAYILPAKEHMQGITGYYELGDSILEVILVESEVITYALVREIDS